VLPFRYAVAYRLMDARGAPTPAGRALAQQLAAAPGPGGGGGGERVVLPVLLACSGEDDVTDFSQGGWADGRARASRQAGAGGRAGGRAGGGGRAGRRARRREGSGDGQGAAALA
jgi:hypothetical protein